MAFYSEYGKLFEKKVVDDSVYLRSITAKTLQETINALPADGTEQTMSLDDYETITEPITIPSGMYLTFTGTKTPVISAMFSGKYLFKTEAKAQFTYNVPGISWESGTSLPETMFYADDYSTIIVNGNGTKQIAYTGRLFYVGQSATVISNADIGGDSIRVCDAGELILNKPTSSLDSYVKELYTGEKSALTINGLVVFDKVTLMGGAAWSCDGTIKAPSVLCLGYSANVQFKIQGISLTGTTIQFVDGKMPYDTEVMRFTGLSSINSLTNGALKLDFPTDNFALYGSYASTDYIISFETVDKDALDMLMKRVDTFNNDCDKYQKLLAEMMSTLSASKLTVEQKNTYSAKITACLSSLKYYQVVEKQSVSSALEVFYGKKGVAGLSAIQDELDGMLNTTISEINGLQLEIDDAIANVSGYTPKNEDDLQAFLDGLNGDEGTEENPANVILPADTDFVVRHLEITKYVIFQCGCLGKHHDGHVKRYFRIRPEDGKSGIVVGPGGHVEFREINIDGFDEPGTGPLIEIEGEAIIDSTTTITGADKKEYVVEVKLDGRVYWQAILLKGKIRNEGNFYHYGGTIEMYYNHGYTEVTGGHTHYVYNYGEYHFGGGQVGLKTNVTQPTIENRGTMRLTGGTITGGHTLIVHYLNSVLYIDGCHLDDSQCETTIEAHDDFFTRGGDSYKLVRLDDNVHVRFITDWTVTWHIVFINPTPPCRRVIFVGDDSHRLSRNHIKWIDYELPKRYRWYFNEQENGLEVRDDKVCDDDDLQNFIDGLSDDNGTEDEPRVLDGDNNQISFRRFVIPDKSHLTIQNITFVMDDNGETDMWSIPAESSVRFENAKLMRSSSSNGIEDYHITVYGDLYITNTTIVNCYIYTYRVVYLGNHVQEPLYVRYLGSGTIESGERVFLPYNGYTFVNSDVENLKYPGNTNWIYRLMDGVIEIWDQDAAGIDTPTVSKNATIYMDNAGSLHVESIESTVPCDIVGSDGQIVYSGTLSGATSRSYGKGLYMVRVGTRVFKCIR